MRMFVVLCWWDGRSSIRRFVGHLFQIKKRIEKLILLKELIYLILSTTQLFFLTPTCRILVTTVCYLPLVLFPSERDSWLLMTTHAGSFHYVSTLSYTIYSLHYTSWWSGTENSAAVLYIHFPLQSCTKLCFTWWTPPAVKASTSPSVLRHRLSRDYSPSSLFFNMCLTSTKRKEENYAKDSDKKIKVRQGERQRDRER